MFRKIGQYRADFGTNENGRVTIKDSVVSVSQDMDERTPDADFEALIYGRQLIQIITDRLSSSPEEFVNIGPMEYDNVADELNCAKTKKCEEVAAARYAEEIAGVNVGNFHIRTDRESQALITGAALQALDDSTYTCQWKTESGFVTLDSATILNVARAVRAHVQTCFDHEAEKNAEVDAAKNKEELEAITW